MLVVENRSRSVAGIYAIGVSIAIAVWMGIREVDFNPLNGWTLVMSTVGGAVALAASPRASWKIPTIASIVIVLGAAPALFSVGLLYAPSVVLLARDSLRTDADRQGPDHSAHGGTRAR